MSALTRCNVAGLQRAALVAALLTAIPFAGLAQTAPASSGSSAPTPMAAMPGMDHSGMGHGSMSDMTTRTTPAPAAARSTGHAHGNKPAKQAPAGGGMSGMKPSTEGDKPTTASTAMRPMPGMTPQPMSAGTATAMPAMDHATMSGVDHGAMNHASIPGMGQAAGTQKDAMSAMSMDSMQGGSAPPAARSPDYSEGVSYGAMKADMGGKRAIGMLLFDQLEAVNSRNGNGQSFELSGWYGQDLNKLWLRSEGDVSHGKLEDGDVEVFWNHAIATYWGSQLGMRHDLGSGPNRDWLAFGVEGLAPYWFKLEATGYVGESGRTAARLRANYEVLFTQRLILEPELEFNLYGKDDPARRIGSGLSDISLGLRLRYEIHREFAPYIGINWVRRVGTTADYARADGQHIFDQQLVAGIRIWF
jgi:copper resistance protein B